MRILMIEDDAVFARTLARALSNRGHEADRATDGTGALAAAEARPPDAVILDLGLGGESGLALIEPLLSRAPQTRILVLTGYASIGTTVAAIKRGAFNYLAKPANADEILAALDNDEPAPTASSPPSLRRLEREHIQRVLDAHGGNVSAAARALGLHRRTLQRKLSKRPASG